MRRVVRVVSKLVALIVAREENEKKLYLFVLYCSNPG